MQERKGFGMERLRNCFVALFLIIWLAAPQTAQAGDSVKAAISPPDVYEHVRLLRTEIEYVRKYIGRPREARAEIAVSDAEPREVFFQALTLFRKANRLSFELTRTRAEELLSPNDELKPRHVYDAVDHALQRIRSIKSKLNLEQQFTKQSPDVTKTPTDVYRSIVQANRQLNLMLDQQFSPSDVYQQLTLAIAYAERLMEQNPELDSTIPDPPKFEANKMPRDVYQRLQECYSSVQIIIEQNGKKSLTLGAMSEEELNQVSPSDVYDIASLLVSELAYLHREGPHTPPPHQAYYPGRKFPADCYQRAGILERQFDQLARQQPAN